MDTGKRSSISFVTMTIRERTRHEQEPIMDSEISLHLVTRPGKSKPTLPPVVPLATCTQIIRILFFGISAEASASFVLSQKIRLELVGTTAKSRRTFLNYCVCFVTER
jgi:hypothetical protein